MEEELNTLLYLRDGMNARIDRIMQALALMKALLERYGITGHSMGLFAILPVEITTVIFELLDWYVPIRGVCTTFFNIYNEHVKAYLGKVIIANHSYMIKIISESDINRFIWYHSLLRTDNESRVVKYAGATLIQRCSSRIAIRRNKNDILLRVFENGKMCGLMAAGSDLSSIRPLTSRQYCNVCKIGSPGGSIQICKNGAIFSSQILFTKEREVFPCCAINACLEIIYIPWPTLETLHCLKRYLKLLFKNRIGFDETLDEIENKLKRNSIIEYIMALRQTCIGRDVILALVPTMNHWKQTHN